MTGMDLVEFLRARIAEDQERALAAQRHPAEGPADRWRWRRGQHVYDPDVVELAGTSRERPPVVATVGAGSAHKHIAYWDPARVLADCETKRRIVDRCAAVDYAMPCTPLAHGILATLALPYADHPQFQEEWRV